MSDPVGPIPPGTMSNFNTILRAARQQRLACVQARDRVTGEEVSLVCAVGDEGGEYRFVPFAVMVGADVYERYEPPIQNEEP